jgi:Fe-S-cluster containining protein
MADLTLEEMRMTAKYFGNADLVNNEMFWLDCLVNYQDKVVPLPLADNAASRRKLHDLLECPPGKCGGCCHYKNVPLSPDDINRLQNFQDKLVKTEKGLELHCENGCPFLADGTCSIYGKRPDVCAEYPIQLPRESMMDGKTLVHQVTYRLKCQASVNVIRAIMKEACHTAPMLLLPDLSLIPNYKDPLASFPVQEAKVENDIT